MRKSEVLVCTEYNIGLLRPFDEYEYCCYDYENGRLDLYLYSNNLKLIIKLSKLLQLNVRKGYRG